MSSGLQVVKLGGSLLTDKAERERLRPGVLERLAGEIARAIAQDAVPLLLAHGSGSFGHFAAAGTTLGGGASGGGSGAASPASLARAVARTQDAAARLHRLVCSALLQAGLEPFSMAPSSLFLGDEGVERAVSGLSAALELGLLPVLYGDVVLDGCGGATIWSTERVLTILAPRIAAVPVSHAGDNSTARRWTRVHWLGTTDGILDPSGVCIPLVTAATLAQARASAGSAEGVDVTGGMRLRLETAWSLAVRGVVSWIYDGRRPGVLERALLGHRPQGTEVTAGRGSS